jgi:hypothetical protein
MGEGTTDQVTRQLLHEACVRVRGKVRHSPPLSDLFEWLLQHAGMPFRGTFNHRKRKERKAAVEGRPHKIHANEKMR